MYIPNLHEKDPNLISENLTTIIQQCLDIQAPVATIQISKKSSEKLSQEARLKLAERDSAHFNYTQTKNPDDLRHFKNLRNSANHFISKERFSRKISKFNRDEMTAREKWALAKTETGQTKLISPQFMKEGDKFHTKKFDIAQSMNRQFLKKIRETQQKIPISPIDPLENFRKSFHPNPQTFNFESINMCELRKVISTMSPTASTTTDYISMKTIKQARKSLEPQLLNLVNSIIQTTIYPNNLKTTKVIPIPKPPKNIEIIDGWRPINIVPAISKIIEKCLMKQMFSHLNDNNIVPHNHHGSNKDHSTHSLILELHDKLVEYYEGGQETALLLLDQSKAYDLVPHHILLGKMKILGYNQKTLDTLESYLKERKQYTQIEHIDSSTLLVGNKSVTQGSTLSCIFYLIFILDIPQSTHQIVHDPISYRNCKMPDIATFVDDNYLIIKKTNKSLQEHVNDTMTTLKQWMDSNQLALNGDKTTIMVLTKNQRTKMDFQVNIQGKNIKHTPKVKILGMILDENLTWDKHVTSILIPSLKNRLRTLHLTTRYMTQKFKRQYTSSIFRGKLLYGIETWGGVKTPLLDQIQKLQNKAADIALKGTPNIDRKSTTQKHQILNWMKINDEISHATSKQVHKIIHKRVPSTLAELMPLNNITSRIQVHRKLAAKPNILNSSKLYRSTFRSRAYHFNTMPGRITSLIDHQKFKKWSKKFRLNPSKVPKDLNKIQMDNHLNQLNLQQQNTPPPHILTLHNTHMTLTKIITSLHK